MNKVEILNKYLPANSESWTESEKITYVLENLERNYAENLANNTAPDNELMVLLADEIQKLKAV